MNSAPDPTVTAPLQFHLAQAQDLADIINWPAYPEEFRDLDYALRRHGWIDEFSANPQTYFYIVEQNRQGIGFSMLAKDDETDAEFRIALHPHHLGRGLGKAITLRTLEQGFNYLQLSRIYLIVRVSNVRAIRLYNSIGFIARGETVQTINNKAAELLVMDITATAFQDSDCVRSGFQAVKEHLRVDLPPRTAE